MKKFYKENRVFSILMLIVAVCICIIMLFFLIYIFTSSRKSVYGNRLDGIGDVVISEKMSKSMVSDIKNMDKVNDAKVNIHGKIIYFDINFNDDASVDDAKNVSIKCLSLLEDKYVKFYDIQFIITNNKFKETKKGESSDNVFPIMGYKKHDAQVITWSHNAN